MVYAILLLFSIFTNMINTLQYPSEYREAANIFMTKSILNGENIYSLDVLNRVEPGLIYLYGPLESLVAAAFVLLFRVSIPTAHYFIAFIVMVTGAALMARMAHEKATTFFPASLAFLGSIYCNWRYGYIFAAPDSFGLFLLILFLFVLSRNNMKNKSLLAALIAVLSFFTKQYFIVIALTGFIYLLFNSKKEACRYTITGILLSGISFVYISIMHPLYWTYALYFLKGPGAGMPSGDIAGTQHNISQISYIGALFIFFFIAVFVKIIVTIYRICIKELKIEFDIKSCEKPLIGVKGDDKINLDILMYAQMFVAMIILYYIGNNAGAFISYYLQLFVPALILLAAVSLEDIRIDNKYINKYKYIVLLVFNLTACIYTIYRAEPRLNVPVMRKIDAENWEDFYSIIREYKHGDVWYSPLGEYPVATTDKYIYNTGMPFVISQKYLDRYNKSEFSQKLFPHAGEIMKQHLDYRENVRNKVLNGEFDLIMYSENMDVVFSEDDMSTHYKKLAGIPLKAGSWSWNVDLYILKEDHYMHKLDY